MSKNRIIALIGAGATVDIGGINSKELTNSVIETDDFLKKVYSAMCEKNPNVQINFEDIMNALEILLSMKARNNQIQNPTSLSTFAELSPKFVKESLEDIMSAHLMLLQNIAEKINDYDKAFMTNEANKFFVDFWRDSLEKAFWDIVTLNYDTCLEQCLRNQFVDGFTLLEKVMGIYVDTNGGWQSPLASRFEPRILEKPGDCSRIMHLHGSINFARAKPNDESNKYSLREGDDDMYKYPSYEQARTNWHKWYDLQNANQAKEIIFNDPIISGLKKPDKVLGFYPYAYYFYEFHKAIINNKNLLIVGYSFGDIYLNNLLLRVAEFHGTLRRVVVITHWDTDKILEAAERMKIDGTRINEIRIFTRNEYAVYSRLMQEEFFSRVFSRNYKCIKGDMLESSDRCARIYFRGFKQAIEKHGKKIIAFLNS